ncbi:indolethylamine N-methyltransferase, partial [Sigmodon hispidus]
MEGKVYKGGEDYENEFSPRDYLDTFYNFDSGPEAERGIIKFSLQSLHQTFSAGGIKGDVLIDIGSGPTIYQLLSACEAFQEIILTDYTPQNLQELQKWLKKEPGAYDWSSIVQHVCELEGNSLQTQCCPKLSGHLLTLSLYLFKPALTPFPLCSGDCFSVSFDVEGHSYDEQTCCEVLCPLWFIENISPTGDARTEIVN